MRPAHEVEQRVHLRMARQKLLTEPNSPQFRAVLDEGAVRRAYGPAQVMRGQLEHLAALADLPNVTLQVLPFDRGGPAAAAGPFTMLQFAEDDLPDIVYLEQLTSAVYLDKPTDVELYRRRWTGSRRRRRRRRRAARCWRRSPTSSDRAQLNGSWRSRSSARC